jgi:hypothetical protein
MKKQFRLSAKKLFLTYPKCDIDINEMLTLLRHKKFIQIEKYFIVKEIHEDNTSHIHVFLELIKKCNIRNPNLLDIKYNEINYHGNYQTCKYKNKTLEYLSKDLNENNHITNMNLNKDYNEMTIEELAIIYADTHGVQKGLEFYKDNAPVLNRFKNISKLKRCITIESQINKNRLINLGVIHDPQFKE